MADAAASLGISTEAYHDIELSDGEIEKVLSLRELRRLCDILQLDWPEIVYGRNSPRRIEGFSATRIAALIREHMISTQFSVSEMEDAVGWEFLADLTESKCLNDKPIVFFQDLASVLRVDWRDLVAACLHRDDSDPR